MANDASNSKKLQQIITNNTAQVSQQTCTAIAHGEISGNSIAIDGSKISGDVGIYQTMTAQSSCVMATQLDTNVSTILGSMTKQSAESSNSLIQLSFASSSNSVDVKQQITNNLTQIISATCNANDEELIHGNTIMVQSGSTVQGNVKIVQAGDAKALCALSATAKVTAFNQAQEQSDQQAVVEDQITNVIALLVVGFLGWCMVEIALFSDEESRSGKRTVTINNYNPNPYAQQYQQQYPTPYQTQYQTQQTYQYQAPYQPQQTYQYQPQYTYQPAYTIQQGQYVYRQ